MPHPVNSSIRTRARLSVALALALLGLAPAAAAAPPTPTPTAPTQTSDGWRPPISITGTVDGTTHAAPVLVYLPSGYSARAPDRRYPLVLALHGWGHSPEVYRDEGDLATWADRYGLVIAVPAMGKTVYETRFYPESRKTWGPIPGTRWVGEVVLPYLRQHLAVLQDRAHTAVIGYSTGGRGALLLAEDYPEFAFAGSLSGTFDLMRLAPKEGEYRIHSIIYGARAKFPERWQRDNVIATERLAALAGVTLFIAHGAADTSVNPNQLDALRDALGRAASQATAQAVVEGPGPTVVHTGLQAPVTFVSAPDLGHDWTFWNGQSPALFAALAAVVGPRP